MCIYYVTITIEVWYMMDYMNKIKTYGLGLLTAAAFAVSAYSCDNGVDINTDVTQKVEAQKHNTVRNVNQYESLDQTVIVGDTTGHIKTNNLQDVTAEKNDTVYNIFQARRTNQDVK